MFPHNARLTDSKKIQRVIASGKRYSSPHLRIYWEPSTAPHPRFTVVVSKKTARFAITRNRIKRRVRAALKGLQELPAMNVVVFPGKTVATLPFTTITEDLQRWRGRI